MKAIITANGFIKAFEEANRDNNFSYEGKKALFDYLEDLEADLEEEIELDVIALCCEYTEYENVQEFITAYGDKYSPDKPEEPSKPEDKYAHMTKNSEDYELALSEYEEELEDYKTELKEYEEELREETLEKLHDHTTVIDVDGEAFIIQDF